MALIEVQDVTKRFWIPSEARRSVREHVLGMFRRRRFERLTVLDGVSFRLEQGERLGIMGANGAGKSTLLKIVCGVYPPDQGRVTINAGLTPVLELGLGWNGELDAVDNILLVCTIGGMGLRQAKAAVDEVLAFAELERFANLQLKHYSSGMASRLAFATAFLTVKEVLILDEVSAVGDVGFKARCRARYDELMRAGHSSILVSHLPHEVAACSRALLIAGGKVVLEGSGEEVAAAYQSSLLPQAG